MSYTVSFGYPFGAADVSVDKPDTRQSFGCFASRFPLLLLPR